jgi:hypothetical protein
MFWPCLLGEPILLIFSHNQQKVTLGGLANFWSDWFREKKVIAEKVIVKVELIPSKILTPPKVAFARITKNW